MDEQYMTEFDYYNYGAEYDKISKGSGGHAKHKLKKESKKFAPSGNVRKIVANVQNAEKKEKQARQRVNSVWYSVGALIPSTMPQRTNTDYYYYLNVTHSGNIMPTFTIA